MFKEGNKYGRGRPAGIKNKRTEQWEAFAEYCLGGGLEKFRKELDKLEGKDFINAFAMLLEYHQPKLQRSEIEQTNNTELIVRVIRDRVGLQRHQPPALTSGSGDGDSTGETV